jgi:phenylalanyl-tRNA synthetase beta chain
MERKEEQVVEIANPVSLNWTTIRCAILPSLIEFLSKNKHVECPQRIFEVGDVVTIDKKSETKTRTIKHLAIAIASSDSSFTHIKEIVESIGKNLGIEFEYTPHKDCAFIDGRCAGIKLKGKKNVLGVLGEINPKVLNNWDIEMPVVAAELDLDVLAKEVIK